MSDDAISIAISSIITDSDEMLLLHEEERYRDYSQAEIQVMRARKRCKEEIAVCHQMLMRWGMFRSNHNPLKIDVTRAPRRSRDDEAARRDVVLCYAPALDGLGRTMDATVLLESYLGMYPTSSSDEEDDDDCSREPQGISAVVNISLTLALAKLYFKVKRNKESMELCTGIQNLIRQHQNCSASKEELCCSLEDASDAYHLAGWVCIHADDHTSAYRIWKEGSTVLPTCSVLATQARKRHCWDHIATDEVDTVADEATTRMSFDATSDFDAFSVPLSLRTQCPALALFDPATQQHRLVFRTKHPILSPSECTRVMKEVDLYHSQPPHNGKWSTVRHSSVKTTDVAAEDIPALRPWLRALLAERLYPMLECAYPKLADGSTLGCKKDGSRMRAHDAFIVRYDADCDMSLSLPEHSDTSVISFTVALNQKGRDFEGGGTWFESISENDEDDHDGKGAVIDADQGHAVAFAGPLRHAGYPVTKGTRLILVLFLYAEDFAYGKFLQDYVEQHGRPCCAAGNDSNKATNLIDGTQCSPTDDLPEEEDTRRPSGDQPGGFVVYNQTVELVSMLNRRAASILDD
jgi:hypothetical protein